MTIFAENLGFICLIISVAAILISYVTPYWTISVRDPIAGEYHTGLLAYCEIDTCNWLLLSSDSQFEKSMPGK